MRGVGRRILGIGMLEDVKLGQGPLRAVASVKRKKETKSSRVTYTNLLDGLLDDDSLPLCRFGWDSKESSSLHTSGFFYFRMGPTWSLGSFGIRSGIGYSYRKLFVISPARNLLHCSYPTGHVTRCM